ncbi:membrane peptidoglycan carboxypeptidase [Marmoricola sp. OAE513]|uniref:transglycosylase domain-containing protein n=1 Tax=Marmoricola sp. OAE513 TaxID=2817894 RepID=UPI001AE506B8
MSANTPRPPRPGSRSASSAGSRRATSARGSAKGPAKGPAKGRGSAKGKGPGKPKKPLTKKEWALKGLKWATIVGVVMAVLMMSIFYFAYRSTKIPNPNSDFQAQTTKVFYAGGKSSLGSFATQNRESIPLAEIPKVMQDAVVAAEDRSFWTNNGIDLKGIVRAAFSNAQGNSTQGASTITQQYVKLLYLTQERTLKRKAKEAILSLKIQQQQSKSQILEGYLNTVYFGRGAYGVQAAAGAFFGKKAKDLDPDEAAMLAAVLNSPNYLSPDRSDESRAALLARYKYVVNGMETTGKLSADVASKIVDRLPKIKKQRTSNLYGGQKGFMLDMVKDELAKLGFDESAILGGGLRVTTTFTKKAMDAAKQAVAEQRPEGLSSKQLHVATASVNVKTGGLMGFYSGQDYLQSQINWAAYGGPPGSTFKAFAIAAGLEAGYSLKDTFDGNSPYEIGGIDFNNQGEGRGKSYGSRISLLTAAENSVNTAFVDMTQAIPNGPRKIVDTAVALGIPADSPGLEPNVGVALGSATIGPISMANAYASIANGGVAHEIHVISKVTRASDGEVLYAVPKDSKKAIDEDVAADTSYALQKVVSNGTGRNARLSDRPVAGKTGTATNDDGDVVSSWFVGFTPQVATAVMYVRGKGSGALQGYMPTFYGGEFPARTFQDLMTRVMEGVEKEDFPKPANLDGKAPSNGHAPAKPTPTKKPTKKPTGPTNLPTNPVTLPPTPPASTPPPPTPSSTPTGQPSSTCGVLNPNPCG